MVKSREAREPSPKVPQRRERIDAVKNRDHILTVAQELFDHFGVESVSMNRIAQEAEVGAGTLYRHFESKSALCFALIQDHIIALANELETLVTKECEPRTTLTNMVLRHEQFKEEKEPLFKGMQGAGLHAERSRKGPVYEALRHPFVKLFEQAAQREGMNPCVDAVFRADMLLSILIGNSSQQQRIEHDLTHEEYAHHISEIFYPHA